MILDQASEKPNTQWRGRQQDRVYNQTWALADFPARGDKICLPRKQQDINGSLKYPILPLPSNRQRRPYSLPIFQILISFLPKEKSYPFWSFLAEVGGYVGMFLGASVMQVPDLGIT